MDSQRRRRYALAGALSVQTAELLREVHRVAGAPGDAPARRQPVVGAAARTYGVAAACLALTARLLLEQRDLAVAEMMDVPPPGIAELGVTCREQDERAAWRSGVRVTAAALAELADARQLWAAAPDNMGDSVVALLDVMVGYVEEIARHLESSEPVVSKD
jgi:hypothetical protein